MDLFLPLISLEFFNHILAVFGVLRPLPNRAFLARTRKNVAQDRTVLAVHEDLSNGFDLVDGEKKILLGNGLLLDPP
jgi:hypothetical protein